MTTPAPSSKKITVRARAQAARTARALTAGVFLNGLWVSIAACDDDAGQVAGMATTSVALADAGPEAGAPVQPTASTDAAAGMPDPKFVAVKPEDALVVLASAQRQLGDCSVGIVDIIGETFTVAASRGPTLSRHTLRKGDVLVCGALYRVVAVGDVGAFLPGATRPGVVIDKRPRTIPGLAIDPASLVLNVGGRTDHQTTTFTNIRVVNGRGLFDVIEGAGAPAAREVGVGGVITAGGRSHQVRAVVAPNRAEGIAGWIELGP
jgi:hypothetical protein